ncbi:MAG: YjcQ family protein [Ligilactobacillus agilis]|nr:YjcQ family protein [Ligilactobacillus agilis]
MAKDDYDVVVFRILVYLYAIFKGEQIFDQHIFLKVISKVEEEYLYRVLEMMQSEGLIEGLQFKKAWGGVVILINDLDDISITSDGIHYLLENSRMKKVKDFLSGQTGAIASLIQLVFTVV